jgi:hypothetical protein
MGVSAKRTIVVAGAILTLCFNSVAAQVISNQDKKACRDGRFLAEIMISKMKQCIAGIACDKSYNKNVPSDSDHSASANCFRAAFVDQYSQLDKAFKDRADNDYVERKAHQDELDMRAAALAVERVANP